MTSVNIIAFWDIIIHVSTPLLALSFKSGWDRSSSISAWSMYHLWQFWQKTGSESWKENLLEAAGFDVHKCFFFFCDLWWWYFVEFFMKGWLENLLGLDSVYLKTSKNEFSKILVIFWSACQYFWHFFNKILISACTNH